MCGLLLWLPNLLPLFQSLPSLIHNAVTLTSWVGITKGSSPNIQTADPLCGEPMGLQDMKECRSLDLGSGYLVSVTDRLWAA